MGRVGLLREPTHSTVLLGKLAAMCNLETATHVGDITKRFTSVTTAAGSFGVRWFRDPASWVVTGEFKHHDALDLARRGITAICTGHYASERPASSDFVIACVRI